MDRAMSARPSRRLAVLDHAAHRPAPARELASGGDVGFVLVDAALEHRAPPLDEPSHALGRVPSRRGVRDLPLGKVLRARRAAKVVPRRLDEHAPQVLVAGLGDAALPRALAAGVLGGREPEPRRERPGALEPGELAGLEDQVRGARHVDALQAPDGVDPALPPGLGRLGLDQPLEAGLVLHRLPDGIDVVREHVVVRLLGKRYRLYPRPVRGGPAALPAAGRGGLAEHASVPEEELRQPLLAALQVLARVVQRAHQVAGRLVPVVGNPHLHDVAYRQHAGQELRVVAVVLPLAVGRGLDHLGHRADDAVDPHRSQPLLQVEPGDARLVDAFGGRVDGRHPARDLGGVVAEGGRAHLAGHRVEGDGLYRARVHVEADEGGSIQHERAPFHACGVAATGSNQTLAIVGLIHGNCMQQGLSMLLCPAHIVSCITPPLHQNSQCHCRKTHEVRTLSRKNVCHFIIDDTRPGVLWGECLLQLEFGAKGTHFVHFCAAWDAAQRNMAVSSHAARAGDGFSTACDYRCVNTYALTCSNICI